MHKTSKYRHDSTSGRERKNMKGHLLGVLLAIAITTILVACGGSSEAKKVDPQVRSAVPTDASKVGVFESQTDLGQAPTCPGDEPLEDGQREVIAQEVKYEVDGAIQEITCVGSVGEDNGAFSKVHIVLKRQRDPDSPVKEEEATYDLQRTSDGWVSPDYLSSHLKNTADQDKKEKQAGQTATQEFSAQATKTIEAIEASAEQTAEAEPAAVKITGITSSLEWYQGTASYQSGYPYFRQVTVTINNTSSRAIFVNLKALVRLGDGTSKEYQDDDCCFSSVRIDPGTQEVKFDIGALVPDDYRYEEDLAKIKVQGESARITEARLVFSEGQIEGGVFYP